MTIRTSNVGRYFHFNEVEVGAVPLINGQRIQIVGIMPAPPDGVTELEDGYDYVAWTSEGQSCAVLPAEITETDDQTPFEAEGQLSWDGDGNPVVTTKPKPKAEKATKAKATAKAKAPVQEEAPAAPAQTVDSTAETVPAVPTEAATTTEAAPAKKKGRPPGSKNKKTETQPSLPFQTPADQDPIAAALESNPVVQQPAAVPASTTVNAPAPQIAQATVVPPPIVHSTEPALPDSLRETPRGQPEPNPVQLMNLDMVVMGDFDEKERQELSEFLIMPFNQTNAVRALAGGTGDDLIQAASSLQNRAVETSFTLGGLLIAILRSGSYRWVRDAAGQLPYRDAGGFYTFCEEVLGIEKRKRQYLMRTYRRLTAVGLNEERLAGIGWTKLRYLADLPEEELRANLGIWLERLRTMGRRELADLTRQSAEEDSSNEMMSVRRFKFTLSGQNAETAHEALEHAKTLIGESTDAKQADNDAFEFVVSEWYGQIAGDRRDVNSAVRLLLMTFSRDEVITAINSVSPSSEEAEQELERN